MHFNLVSLFPEFFDSPLSAGLMGKGVASGVVSFARVNPRDFTTDKHHHCDDTPYGGGPGMVMLADPVAKALESIENPGRMLLLSPRGKPFSQAKARELAAEEALTLVCGRYEGVDERLLELFPLEQVSVGDYVLNGGEAGALCLVEAVARLVPGFMGKEASGEEESFAQGLLEYPHYTRPPEYRGLRVPEVLTSGDHARIAAWRREKALAATLACRPEMLDKVQATPGDVEYLRGLGRSLAGRNLHVALVHGPVLSKEGKTTSVSLTNLDIHDISRVSRAYGLAGVHIVTPLQDQQDLAGQILAHWVHGAGAVSNPDRAQALGLARVAATLDEVLQTVAQQHGREPKVLATTARVEEPAKRKRRKAKPGQPEPEEVSAADARGWLANGPVVLLLGTGHGLAPEIFCQAHGRLRPIRWLSDYNHLSVRAAAAITLDRLLGDYL